MSQDDVFEIPGVDVRYTEMSLFRHQLPPGEKRSEDTGPPRFPSNLIHLSDPTTRARAGPSSAPPAWRATKARLK